MNQLAHINRFFCSLLFIFTGCSFFEDNFTQESSTWGVDLSHHQKQIDWDEIALNPPNFVFLKATEGTTHQDTKYAEYKKEFERLNVPVGAYHFFSYTTSGETQAENFIKTANLKTGNLHPVLDVEYRKNMPEAKIIVKNILTFIEVVNKRLGIKPIIYCECAYYNEFLKAHLNNDHPLWISSFSKYKPRCGYTFWQQTDQFKHNAFPGTVDFNIFNGVVKDLDQYILP